MRRLARATAAAAIVVSSPQTLAAAAPTACGTAASEPIDDVVTGPCSCLAGHLPVYSHASSGASPEQPAALIASVGKSRATVLRRSERRRSFSARDDEVGGSPARLPTSQSS